VRNALRAFLEREERKRANSQETPVVSQTPTDTDDAPQPSNSDARINGAAGPLDGRGVLNKDKVGEMEGSVPFEAGGRAEPEPEPEPEPGVAETQESVLSSPKASRKRVALERIGNAEKRTKGGEVTGMEQRADSAQERAEKEAGGSGEEKAKGIAAVLEAEQLAGEPGVCDEWELMWGGKNGLKDDGKSEKCARLEGFQIRTVCENGGKETSAQVAKEGEAVGGCARYLDSQSKEMGIGGRQQDGSAVNEQLLSKAAGDASEGVRERLLQVLKGPREVQLEFVPTGMGVPRETASTPGEGGGKAEEEEKGEEKVGGAQLVRWEGVRSKAEAPLIEGPCIRNRGQAGGKMDKLAESAVAAPTEEVRNQETVQTDHPELALLGCGGVDGAPQYAQVSGRRRESVERNGEGVMGGRLSARPLLSKVQELLTDPEWEGLDVVGLVEAQLLVSDLSSKIARCLRARAPDFFANR
jgi:hypothetical protein